MLSAPRQSTEARLSLALGLLSQLSGAGATGISRQEVQSALGCDEPALDAAIEVVSLLMDRESGARAAVLEEGGRLSLAGDAAELKPLRLTAEESAVLAHVLDAAGVAPDARERIERAVAVAAGARDGRELIADGAGLGPYFAPLSEAIRDGVRVHLAYRGHADTAARERTVDPGRLQVEDGSAYLLAWDVKARGERRYRLDRIEGLDFTDDSVEPHPYKATPPAESLKRRGACAELRWDSRAELEASGWQGIDAVRDLPGGGARARVFYSSQAWLFDQVLAAGGRVCIESPASLRRELVAYAAGLVQDRAR